MSGPISAGGLITGIDSNSIIAQLMQLERAPINRLQQRISTLQTVKQSVADFRTQLLALRNSLQDLRLSTVFDQFSATSSAPSVLTADISGANPVNGAYTINVTQLASATTADSSGKLGASINPAATLTASGIHTAVTAGTFTINGVQFTVDPATDTLNGLLGTITSSTAGVTATYNATTDKITIENTAAGNTSVINFGATGDTSNLLDSLNIRQATQSTGGTGSTTATSTGNLGAVNPGAVLNTINFSGGALTGGSFQINGITINVDPTTDTLSDVLGRINSSDAQVTASYDSATDSLRFVSKTLGSRTIGFTAGTSNFLTVTNLTGAVQTGGNDSQFTVNGGPVQTRNTNKVADAVGGVTLNFLSAGTSTVTVSADDAKAVAGVKKVVDEFNKTLTQIAGLSARGGALAGDASATTVDSFLKSTIFSQVSGIVGGLSSLVDIGISTGSTFDPKATTQLSLDETKFLEALRTNRAGVKTLFNNSSTNGIADQLFTYLDGITGASGYLNEQSKSNGTIDQQVKTINDQIASMEARITQHENRLRAQFTRLEQIASQYQSQGAAFSNMASRFVSL